MKEKPTMATNFEPRKNKAIHSIKKMEAVYVSVQPSLRITSNKHSEK